MFIIESFFGVKPKHQSHEDLWSDDGLSDSLLTGPGDWLILRKYIIPVGNKSRKQAEEALANLIARYEEESLIDREFPGWQNLPLKTGFITIVNLFLARIKELERQVGKNKNR